MLFLLACAASAAFSLPTSPLDALSFYGPSLLTPASSFRAVIAQTPSLNAQLWAAANSTRAEQPFAFPPHPAGMELVVNTSAAPACTGAYLNMSSAAGVATLPTGPGFQGIFLGLSLPECASLCCSQSLCAAFAFYDTADEGLLCQAYAAGYATGPQPFPAGHVRFAQGGALTAPPLLRDDLQNGLRSGTYLGGLGTGGYELRADGTAHLSTIRNQAPAAEPWQGTVRDFALAVALGGQAFAVAVRPLCGLSPVPQLVYEAAFPVARFSFLGSLRLFAYTALSPGDANASNTPAVLFTLHATNTASEPVNVTFVVAQGLALRNDWEGVPSGAGAPLPVPAANASACAAACVAAAAPPCLAWQFQASQGLCWLDAQRHAQGANAAGLDSGFPGSFSISQAPPGVAFTTAAAKAPNALGAQGLWARGGAADSGTLSFGAAAGATMEEALAQVLLVPTLPAGDGGGAVGGAGMLHGAAAARVAGLGAGDTASLTLAHAWHFPTFFWYRDRFAGSDNGNRYATTHASLADVVGSLNVTTICARLLAWQAVFSGLPHPLLRDAAANYFSHLRTSVWHASGQYRQWESLEFADWGNPTNGDERHLPYLLAAPDTMRSQLLTWVQHAQNADGSFYCIIMSEAGDQQYGRGDPCANAPPHPDDISMVLIAAYEQLIFRNDSALVAQVYPALQRAFGYYVRVFNSTPWALPYKVHETYDAVAESASITGEGNLGTSLFNALQYVTGLLCMAGLADSQGDAATAGAARAQARLAQASIQRNLFLPSASVYIGDTLEGNAMLFTEPSGLPYHGSDNLHGQALAYRLGFGDLLPRTQMQLHSGFIARDLDTPFGLQFDTYSQQNWLMADHTMSTLLLHWNEAGAWNASLKQLAYFRDGRKDASRHPAVVDTATGSPALLNFYGYALFFYHTLHGFSGQATHLPQQRVSLAPHFSAFNASGAAVLPLLLAGALGTVEITPSAATLSLLLPDTQGPAAYAFLNVTICQHVFLAPAGGAPLALRVGAPLRLALPAPCATALPASASNVSSTDFCAIVGRVTDSSTAFAGVLPAPLPQPLSLEACEARALAHRFCGYVHSNGTSACTLVPGGATCFLAAGGGGGQTTKGLVRCDFSSVYTPPRIINASQVASAAGVGFAPPFAPLDSALYSFVPEQGLQGCMAQAAQAQVCGGAFVPALEGARGACAGGGPCCLLNPYKGCALGAAKGPWGNASTAFVFGDTGVFPVFPEYY